MTTLKIGKTFLSLDPDSANSSSATVSAEAATPFICPAKALSDNGGGMLRIAQISAIPLLPMPTSIDASAKRLLMSLLVVRDFR